jgi:hypothetical protein
MGMDANERALADQIEAEAQAIGEHFKRPQSADQINHSIAEFWRQAGVPVVDATHEKIGNELRFDLKIALPRGQG